MPTFLSLFDWDSSGEARGVWSGYLTSARMTPELWPVMRPLFLKVFPHSNELAGLEDQFYSFFAFLMLREEFPLEAQEARHALTVGSAKGRARVAWYWWRQADSATDYGAALFRDRLEYLLTDVWPLELDLKDQASSENLAYLALCCGTEFEGAVETITPLLTKIGRPGTFFFLLNKKNHSNVYPSATLRLVDSLISDQTTPFDARDLRAVLNRISAAEHGVTDDPRFVRLDALVRRFE